MNSLAQEFETALGLLEDVDVGTFEQFRSRLREGKLLRDDNPASHLCVFFLPFDARSKQVFLVHHINSGGLWLAPGGHIESGESVVQTLNREIREELGVSDYFVTPPQPFFTTIKQIAYDRRACKEHFDLWYLMPIGRQDFQVSAEEFYGSGWYSFEEARKVVTDRNVLSALDYLARREVRPVNTSQV